MGVTIAILEMIKNPDTKGMFISKNFKKYVHGYFYRFVILPILYLY